MKKVQISVENNANSLPTKVKIKSEYENIDTRSLLYPSITCKRKYNVSKTNKCPCFSQQKIINILERGKAKFIRIFEDGEDEILKN